MGSKRGVIGGMTSAEGPPPVHGVRATDVQARAVAPDRPSSRMAFWLVTATLALFLAASSAPSPLYVVYQARFGFSATMLTLVFAVYALGLLGSLLTVGGLSDHVGRRPVLLGAVVLEAGSLVLFLVARDVAVLAAARLTQGIATGAALTSLGATLVDLDPPHARGRAGLVNAITPSAGLAAGALGSGLLVQSAPAPTHLVYAVLLAGLVLAACVMARVPDTAGRRPGAWAALRPRIGIPIGLRPQMLALVPTMVASWALSGLYLSLGPSSAVTLFGLRSHVIGGLLVMLLSGTGAATSYVLRARRLDDVLRIAGVLLAVGMAVTITGVESDVALVAALGTVVAGAGLGAAVLGAFGTVAKIAPSGQRGELLAAAYVISYLSFSVPAVLAGVASTSFGLKLTAVVYGMVVVVLALAALAAQRLLAQRPATVAVPT